MRKKDLDSDTNIKDCRKKDLDSDTNVKDWRKKRRRNLEMFKHNSRSRFNYRPSVLLNMNITDNKAMIKKWLIPAVNEGQFLQKDQCFVVCKNKCTSFFDN